MSHRIRLAMTEDQSEKLGGEGTSGIVEADETYFGKHQGFGKGSHGSKKQKVVALVECKGHIRAFHVPSITADTLKPLLEAQIDKSARLMTDQAQFYKKSAASFRSHETVDHSIKEYARGDVTTNSVEGFFGTLKMGIRGVYQHVSPEHLNRYVSEFAFRYNYRKSQGVNDYDRATQLLGGIVGKRLTYKTVGGN